MTTRIGEYEILDLVAKGGMAEVYRARRADLPELDIALKVVRAEVASDPEVRRLFVSEARVALALSHAHVVQTFDVARHEDGIVLAMEFVDGLDVARLTHTHARRESAPLPLRHVVSIAADALLGLDYAHRSCDSEGRSLGVIHRDISPGNILVSRAGEVKVADFGVASSALREHQSMDGMLKGKLAYMSPEQMRAEPLDARTDVYAMGVVLYEMLTGVRPFSGTGPAIIPDVVSGHFPGPRSVRADVPESLADVVLRAMSADRRDRFRTALDMSEALRDAAFELGLVPSQLELGSIVDQLSDPARQSIPPSGPALDETALERPSKKAR